MNGKLEILEGLLIGILAITTTGAGATNNVAASAAAAPIVDSQDYDVKRFLEEAPPLRKIIYGVDGNYFIHNGKQLGGIIYYEGAIQGDTFYKRPVQDIKDFPEAVQAPDGFVIGKTSEGRYWTLSYDNYAEGSIRTSSDADPSDSATKHFSKQAIASLNGARSLWIAFMEPGTFRWTDDNRFEARVEGPPELLGTNDIQKVLTGEVTEKDSEGRISRIEYRWPAMPETRKNWLRFLYLSPVGETKLPSKIISGNSATTSDGISITTNKVNVLCHVDIGLDSGMGTQGYDPGMFLKIEGTNTPQPKLLVETNNNILIMTEKGLVPIGSEHEQKPSPKWWGVILIVLILLTPFLWIFRKNFRRKE